MAKNTWTSNRRLYLNAEGKAVEADDPTRQSLLVAEGGEILLDEAARLGLVEVTEPTVKVVETKLSAGPTQNKAAAKPEAPSLPRRKD